MAKTSPAEPGDGGCGSEQLKTLGAAQRGEPVQGIVCSLSIEHVPGRVLTIGEPGTQRVDPFGVRLGADGGHQWGGRTWSRVVSRGRGGRPGVGRWPARSQVGPSPVVPAWAGKTVIHQDV